MNYLNHSNNYVELQFIIRCGTMLSLRSHRVHFVVVFLRQHRGQPEVARARYITQKSSQNDLSNKWTFSHELEIRISLCNIPFSHSRIITVQHHNLSINNSIGTKFLEQQQKQLIRIVLAKRFDRSNTISTKTTQVQKWNYVPSYFYKTF
jgi:hypothetical protein